MSQEDTAAKIIDLAAQTYRKDAASITRDTPIKELGQKSLQLVALNSRIEEELGVGVPIREVMKMKTVGDLIDRVDQER